MPMYPGTSNVRPVNTVLSKAVAGYANAPKNFLQDRLLPVLFDGSNVPEGQDHFVTATLQRWKANAMFGDPTRNTAISRGQDYPRGRGGDFDPLTITAQKYGSICEVPYEDIKSFQGGPTPYELQQLSVEVQTVRIKREGILAKLFLNNNNWTNTAALSALTFWSAATSDPNGDFITACDTVEQYGESPNVCVLTRDAATLLRQNDAFLEFDDTSTDRTVFNDERLMAVIKSRYGIDHVFIAKAMMNTSSDPDAAPTMAGIWDSVTDSDDNDMHACMWIGVLPMDAAGNPISGPKAGLMDKGGDIVPMVSTAAGQVIVDGWTVETEASFDDDLMKHKIRYFESIFIVSELYGYLLTNIDEAA